MRSEERHEQRFHRARGSITLSLHAGQRPGSRTGHDAVPIYQTTSYVFSDTDHAAGCSNLERADTLLAHLKPTVGVLEERSRRLKRRWRAVATASGQAALHLIIATLMGAGG